MESKHERTKTIAPTLIGKELEEASTICNQLDIDLKLIRKDEKDYSQDMNVRFTRICIEVDNNIVTSAKVG